MGTVLRLTDLGVRLDIRSEALKHMVRLLGCAIMERCATVISACWPAADSLRPHQPMVTRGYR
jgi:hypothetical protein